MSGDYLVAWLTAGGLCVLAAGLCLLMPKVPVLAGKPDLELPATDSF